jgi:uncharacterized RDD family membrane protein YckC
MSDTGNQTAFSADRAPDPFSHFELYRGLAWKRTFAYFLDVAIIAVIMTVAFFVFGIVGIVTFGLLHAPLIVVFTIIPFAYHTILLGGAKHATLGMRLFGVEMRSLTTGYPDYVQAAVQTALFYLSVGFTSFIITLWALFDTRRRMLHDILAGTYCVNRRAAANIPP